MLLGATTENVGLLGLEWPCLGTVGAADYPQAYGLIEGLSADVLHRRCLGLKLKVEDK